MNRGRQNEKGSKKSSGQVKPRKDKISNNLDIDYDKNIGNEFNILFVGDTKFWRKLC